MAIEYLGHKESQLSFLLDPIDQITKNQPHRVADIFCGTAAVAIALKKRGHTVLANDSLEMCATFAQAALFNDLEPQFRGLRGHVHSSNSNSVYLDVLSFLEQLQPREGFITQNFSPRSATTCEHERRYFTEENALKIDAIRWQIQSWDKHLSLNERAILLTDLVRAANSVSNVAGTYGCYLKHWKARALSTLRMAPSNLVTGGAGHRVTCMDAATLAPMINVDIVYADPPYTKRQYSAYYHVPETIVVNDNPVLEGSTGLRPWREKQSAWCYRRQAPRALEDLVASLHCQWFLLSYNEDGQIRHDEILDILGKHGNISFREKDGRRYKSADKPHQGAIVRERLYILRRIR